MNKPKGTKDNFGNVQEVRKYIKDVVETISQLNNFTEIDTPIFEKLEVFSRSVGETSDIVSKEMYVFKDKKGRELVLRPEGTAGVIRAFVENKIFAESMPVKLFYYGPMFRYERPQKGRQRQFTQFGIEMICDPSPYTDAEAILFAKQILDTLNIKYKLVINSLGNKETRDEYSQALRKYFEEYKDQLTEDSINRLDKNPLRILDDKIDGEKDFVKNAPKINEYYSTETQEYFDKLTNFLSSMGIEYVVDHNLVRGLDYYSDTSFEFVSDSGNAGSQSTLIGGGRYSSLVSQFGGPDLSGVGFGMGIERIQNELEEQTIVEKSKINPEIFVLNISNEHQNATLGIVYMLRKAGYITEWNQKTLSLPKAFNKADKAKASLFIIAGSKELNENKVSVKFNGQQETISIESLIDYIDEKLGV